MKLLWPRCQGVTLIELLVALGLGASLSAAILQLFIGSMHIQSVYRAVQDLQHRSAYAQFLLRSAIYSSASPCPQLNSEQNDDPGYLLELLDSHVAAANALPESLLLILRTDDCEVPVHLYYIGRRGNDDDNPAGLFRRRQRSDGSYHAAEELVEGVRAMTAYAGTTVSPGVLMAEATAAVAYVDINQVADWSQVFNVNITLSMQHLPAAAERRPAFAALGTEALSVEFSTALRQNELHRGGAGS
jgi:prepilin-type N-terminal cleavage/methylation domain-containing protein